MSKLIEVELKKLNFDPENPRLPNKYKNKPEDEVLTYLLLECNLIELMLSIGQHGFFPGEPLLVVPTTDKKGYIVVEGNRRLGALKLLQPNKAPPVKPKQVEEARALTSNTPDIIPVLCFDDRSEILSYLGYRHITGIKEWDPLAKARYLKQLRARHPNLSNDEAHKVLAKEIGSKANHVAKLLTGMALLEYARDEGLLKSINLEEDDIQFSLLTTGIGYTNICNFIGIKSAADVEILNLKKEQFGEFFRWTFEKNAAGHTVLGESRNIENLAKIVASERALSELRRQGDIASAILFTSGPLDTLRTLMHKIENQIDTAQSTLSMIEGLTEADVDQSTRIRKAALALNSSIIGAAQDQ